MDEYKFRIEQIEKSLGSFASPEITQKRLIDLEESLKNTVAEIDQLEIELAKMEEHKKVVNQRVKDLENSLTWIVRIILGAVVLFLLSVVLKDWKI